MAKLNTMTTIDVYRLIVLDSWCKIDMLVKLDSSLPKEVVVPVFNRLDSKELFTHVTLKTFCPNLSNEYKHEI